MHYHYDRKENTMLRAVAIHDLSCFGKCSLTAALPIISSAGIEVSVIPTAVLSTHTGGFEGFTYRDLTADIMPIVNHWRSLSIEFDAIYTGFLGALDQINIVMRAILQLRSKETFIAVDPVMADNGALYQTIPNDYPKGMINLCAGADLITPNITEAAFLLNEPYCKRPHTKEYIEELLVRLAAIGPRYVVITGTGFSEDSIGAAAYDKKSGIVTYSFYKHLPGIYHGAGDVFSSAMIAAMLKGLDVANALKIAVEFTSNCIQKTHEAGTDLRFGLRFEGELLKLAKALIV